MNNEFFIVGVGPGDPELMTRKALRVLDETPVFCVPKGKKDGASVALGIVEGALDIRGKEILEVHFPMERLPRNREPGSGIRRAWTDAAREVHARLSEGSDVAFPTLGDPTFYSTAFYLTHALAEIDPGAVVRVIPGVTAPSASAAAAGLPLCLGDERVAVVPATYGDDRVREALRSFDTVVLMKIHRVLDRLLSLLEEEGRLEGAVVVERASLPGERIVPARDARGLGLHYFSTMIVRKE